jgi:hypothetical protein
VNSDPLADRRCRHKKQSAGTREAFRRLNYAFLTLVGKGDAKSRHSEILIIAVVTRFQIYSSINDRSYGSRLPLELSNSVASFNDRTKSIRMVRLTEDKVPREVSHQANVAGDTKFQAEA